MDSKPIYCTSCYKSVDAQLLYGTAIYPHREDLGDKSFYQCPYYGNYVGCHKDGRPLRTIPSPQLRKARNMVHSVIDEYWLPTKDRKKRKQLYKKLSELLGREYHTGALNTVEECDKVVDFYRKHFA